MSKAHGADAERLLNVITLDSELNKVKDVDILLERILTEARKVVQADAGSIYIRKGDNLAISYAQNATQQARLPKGEKLIYKFFEVPINTKSISGYVAATGELVNIRDVYQLPEDSPFGYNSKYDKLSGYRSTSMLTIPLKTNNGDLLGVIQFINKISPEGEVCPFNQEDEILVTHFAANVTVALQRAQMTPGDSAQNDQHGRAAGSERDRPPRQPGRRFRGRDLRALGAEPWRIRGGDSA